MIRIQMKELDGQLVLQVEGRLAGAFELELLKDCWQEAHAKQPGRKISVDLKSVTCIDQAGRRLLQSMHRSGVAFVGAGLSTQDILEQVMERRNASVGAGDCE
jgi:anti-anti-sigma regulatory factor